VDIAKKLVRFWPFAAEKKPRSPRFLQVPKRRKALVVVAAFTLVYAVFHIALVAASEFSLLLRDPLYADKELKLSRLEQTVPPGSSEVLFLGTSRTGNGFDAGLAQAILNENNGRPVVVFNWGIPASGPVNNLIHLRRILRDGHRPSHLLLEFFSPSFLCVQGEKETYEVRFTEGANLEWSELKWLGEYGFPTERLREQRQEVLIEPWAALRFRIMGRLRPSLIPYYLRYDWSRSPDANGWCPLIAESVTDEQRKAGIERTKGEFGGLLSSMIINDVAVRAYREILTIACREGMKISLVRLPEGTNLRGLYPPSAAARFDQLVKGLALEFGCKVIDSSEWMIDNAFLDDSHLMRKGAVEYTERLVRESLEQFLHASLIESR
jgi:hypothetical protein